MLKPDSLIGRLLGRALDQLLVSLLCILLCLPVVTAGPALTSLYAVEMKIAQGEEGGVLPVFFAEFKNSFKRSSLIGLFFLVLLALLGGAFYLLLTHKVPVLLYIVGLILLAILFALLWVFPLMAKFEDQMLNTVKNAFLLSFVYFPTTILMVILRLIPVGIFLVLPKGMLLTYVGFWVFFFPGLTSLLDCLILKNIFKHYSKEDV